MRSMLVGVGLPGTFWAEAVSTATYIKNCTPRQAFEVFDYSFETPYEGWFGATLELSHLKV
ncbi:hypothetical protein L873DRAFT_1784631 [Choiromyces venosus 120613-1]|uniref:Uncharacterized protein n=1 Tax=Choiromyces venosus 120613-1 TaxID=1336337 RepID=A0A3N4IXQ3_9PEZI|nr:hypothetical protein L873DRAFT_1784631 [Choiromyces venosus 120613-1]